MVEISKCLINALTGHVGTKTHFSGNPTYQDLAPCGDRNLHFRTIPPPTTKTEYAINGYSFDADQIS